MRAAGRFALSPPRAAVLVALAAAVVTAAAPAAPAAASSRARTATLYDYAGEGLSCIAGATGGDLSRPTSSAVVQRIIPSGSAHGGQLKTVFNFTGALPGVTYELGVGNDSTGCQPLAGSVTTDAQGDATAVLYSPQAVTATGYFAYVIHPEPFIPPDPLAIMFSTLVSLDPGPPH
jgi:hypothetical protein